MGLRAYLRQLLARRLQVPEIPVALERLAASGFQPRLVYDVGAYCGDFARCCLRIWPDSHIVCFEALEHRLRDLNELSRGEPRMTVIPGLLGATASTQVAFHENETASSVLEDQVIQQSPVKFRSMRTVDGVVQESREARAPCFLKLDVQGYELEVLKGSEDSLPQIEVILAEINLLDVYKNVPLFAEVIGWLDAREWVAYDICGLTRRPLDLALWQADIIFVKRDSPLRADKRWSA